MPIFSSSPTTLAICGALPLLSLLLLAGHCWLLLLSRKEKLFSLSIICVAFFAFWPSLYHASNLTVSPDSVEYAVGAWRMFSRGSYDIILHGESFPPRYPFGFSLFVLLPGLLIFPTYPLGAGIISIVLIAAGGAASVFLIGSRLHSHAAGMIGVGVYLLLPGLALTTQEIVTNAPAAAFWLIALAFVAVGLRSNASFPTSSAIGIGIAVMLATASRPLSALVLGPIVLVSALRRLKLSLLTLQLLPTVGLSLLYALYNEIFFGSPLRSGYSFWCAIPYDFTTLVFNPSYIPDNLASVWESGLVILLPLAIYGVYSTRSYGCKAVASIACASAFLVAAVHLTYFYSSSLFFLQATAVLTPFVGICVAECIRAAGIFISHRATLAGLLMASLVVKTVVITPLQSRNPHNEYTQAIRDLVPDRALLISGLNAAYLAEVFAAEKKIDIMPISRRVEYANKVIVPRKLPLLEPMPTSPLDHRSSSLKEGQFIEAFDGVAVEQVADIIASVRAGRNVFLDTLWTRKDEQIEIEIHFSLVPVMPGLSRLVLTDK